MEIFEKISKNPEKKRQIMDDNTKKGNLPSLENSPFEWEKLEKIQQQAYVNMVLHMHPMLTKIFTNGNVTPAPTKLLSPLKSSIKKTKNKFFLSVQFADENNTILEFEKDDYVPQYKLSSEEKLQRRQKRINDTEFAHALFGGIFLQKEWIREGHNPKKFNYSDSVTAMDMMYSCIDKIYEFEALITKFSALFIALDSQIELATDEGKLFDIMVITSEKNKNADLCKKCVFHYKQLIKNYNEFHKDCPYISIDDGKLFI